MCGICQGVMTPTKSIASEITQVPSMHLDVEQIPTFELKVENRDLCIGDSLKHPLKFNMSSNSFDTDRTIETCNALSNDVNEEVTIVNSASLSSETCQDSFSNGIVSSKVSMFCDETLKTYSFVQHSACRKKTILEMKEFSLKELTQLFEDLTNTVEAVSSELVQLLLENDSLQQESDARNVAIEQLLKMTVKNTENELRPIQMSVVLPSDGSNDSVNEF